MYCCRDTRARHCRAAATLVQGLGGCLPAGTRVHRRGCWMRVAGASWVPQARALQAHRRHAFASVVIAGKVWQITQSSQQSDQFWTCSWSHLGTRVVCQTLPVLRHPRRGLANLCFPTQTPNLCALVVTALTVRPSRAVIICAADHDIEVTG